jgi:hypothetical protein
MEMAKIYNYRKITDEFTTYCLREPDYPMGTDVERITELCTHDGVTWVSVPDSVTLPPQPEQIAATLVEMPIPDPPLGYIRLNSPCIMLINQRVVDRIRERYSMNDEIKMLRIGPSPETEAYNDWVEECRAWGRGEKAKLGL